eukprot:8870596-Lingulodinium_polyedra.AAC.1
MPHKPEGGRPAHRAPAEPLPPLGLREGLGLQGLGARLGLAAFLLGLQRPRSARLGLGPGP